MTKEFYVIETGEYSYTQVVGVTDDKAEADRIAELIGAQVWGPFRIGEIRNDKTAVRTKEIVSPHRYPLWRCEMRRDRKMVRCHVTKPFHDSWRGDDDFIVPVKLRYEVKKNRRETKWRLHATLSAKDEQHAAKICNELITQILAGSKPEQGDL